MDPLFDHRGKALDQSAHQREEGIEETFFTPQLDASFVRVVVPSKRLLALRIFCLSIITLLLAKAFILQMILGERYRQAAELNRLRTELIPAKRGIITDRNGTPLVENIPTFLLVARPQELPNNNAQRSLLLNSLIQEYGVNLESIKELITGRALTLREYSLSTILTYSDAMRFEIHRDQFPGIDLQILPTRRYTSASATASAILGFVGAPSPTANLNTNKHHPFSLEGKTGIEAEYDNHLRGTDGAILWEYDAQGFRKRKISERAPTDGKPLALTIDQHIQLSSEKALSQELERIGKKKGVVIVMNAQTGELYSIVSLPAYSSNSFTLPERSKERLAILNDPNAPLFFRAIAGQYPSGSLIKPLIAATALEEGLISERTSVLSTGGITIGSFFFPDWKAGGHGRATVIRALAESINTFFYLLVGGDLRIPSSWNTAPLGIERLTRGLGKFGWGSPTGIDLPGEATGFLPSPEWKERIRKERWYIGDTYHYAIGQGDLLVTPIQVASSTAIIANGGYRRPPVLIKDRRPLSRDEEPVFSNKTFRIVKMGMREAVTGGSARRLNDLPFPIWSKTGTAQTGRSNATHSWITAFADIKQIPIVVTVLVEEGGEGSGSALTVAKQIYQSLPQLLKPNPPISSLQE